MGKTGEKRKVVRDFTIDVIVCLLHSSVQVWQTYGAGKSTSKTPIK